MACLSFNYNNNFLYAIIYWLLEIFIRLWMYLGWDEFFRMSENEVQNEYIYVILLVAADLLAGFLVLYVQCSLRKTHNKNGQLVKSETARIGNQELIYTDMGLKISKDFLKKLSMATLFDYVNRSLFWIAYAVTDAKNKEIYHQIYHDFNNTLDIIMRYLLSILILKMELYKHRVFSMMLIIFGFALILPTDIYLMNMKEGVNHGDTSIYVLISDFRAICFPMRDIISKTIFKENFIMPEQLIFMKGIMEAMLIIVITPILYFSFGLTWEIVITNKNIIIIFVYTLVYSARAYLLTKIIYNSSAQSVSLLIISQSVSGAIYEVVDFIRNQQNKKTMDIILLIIRICGIIFIAFSTLVYDEVVIIKKWGLDKKVKISIERGAILDTFAAEHRGESIGKVNIPLQTINDIHDDDEDEDEDEKESSYK